MMPFDKASNADLRVRKRRRSKRIFRLAAILFAMLLLAGCSILSELNLLPSTSIPTQPSGETPQATFTFELPTPSPTSSSGKPKNELIIWVPPEFDPKSGSSAGELFNSRLNEFVTVHPGLSIDVRIKAATGQGGLLDSLSATSAAAPTAIPSLVALSRPDTETAALKALILPWDEMIGTGSTPVLYPYASALGEIQGMKYGLPFMGDALVMVYRPLQVGYAPTSWNEYTTRGYPVIFPAADPLAMTAMQMLLSLSTEDQTAQRGFKVDQENLKKSYFTINEGVTSGVFPYWLADYDSFDAGYQAFLDNRANYAVVWASTVINHLPDNVQIAPLPGVNAATFTLANGWMWVLPNAPEENRQLTVALVEYLADPQFLAEWTETADLLPTSQSILTRWTNQTDLSVLNDVASSARIVPANEFSSAISPILQQGVLGMVRGQINYLQAFENSIKDLELISPSTGG